MIDKEPIPTAPGHDGPAMPEKWKPQRVFRERQRVRCTRYCVFAAC